ncbi:hypothetical protein AJ79_00041 [Helicocarpus griseus UAMH5409]|uniref:Uncharacterized protein n=1 Tax=Helicocarpus griseus UAMH5409 TaxID=1447875 RepID=A0A2B7YEH0_9EURO|nr:hypothetical protein AJ79_00041 [Helicocarpus griseus UAMH5409]
MILHGMLPYVEGSRFTVRSHNPPPPGSIKKLHHLTKEAKIERSKILPLKRCILHLPSGGSDGNYMVTFEVVNNIRAGPDHDAQVVAVRVLDSGPAFPEHLKGVGLVVAKLYYPLFSDHAGDDDTDPFLWLARQYEREAASYHRLSDLQGSVIPVFYGSYSLELPVEGSPS